jgi:hypothetical protein
MLVIDMEKFISTPSGRKQSFFSVCASEILLSSCWFKKSVTIVQKFVALNASIKQF